MWCSDAQMAVMMFWSPIWQRLTWRDMVEMFLPRDVQQQMASVTVQRVWTAWWIQVLMSISHKILSWTSWYYYGINCNFIRFQQDNAMPHTSGIIYNWFSTKGFIYKIVRNFPAQNPDSILIKNVWYKLIMSDTSLSVRSIHTQLTIYHQKRTGGLHY